MDTSRQTLRRVGVVLIVAGMIDIGFMVYCVMNSISYSSSFNIFAVVAGIYLVKGHLGAARLVTWFSAFFLTGFGIAALLLFPQLQPLEYALLQIRLHPLGAISTVVLMVSLIALLAWIYVQLRSPAVVEARALAGQRSGAPLSAFLGGAALVLGLAVMMQLTVHGELGRKATRLAEQEYGTNHKYFVTSIHWGGRHVWATLTGFNQTEAKAVRVEWED
jgi:hypothetical protein